jgi:hypothetical protein
VCSSSSSSSRGSSSPIAAATASLCRCLSNVTRHHNTPRYQEHPHRLRAVQQQQQQQQQQSQLWWGLREQLSGPKQSQACTGLYVCSSSSSRKQASIISG